MSCAMVGSIVPSGPVAALTTAFALPWDRLIGIWMNIHVLPTDRAERFWAGHF
jgi:hypothetical protein